MILCLRKIISFTLVFALAACSQNPQHLIDEWKDDGWTYVATHGTEGDVKRTGKLQSEKAEAVEAAWVEGGNRKTKLYQQRTYFYAVLRFIKHNEDEFVVVMKKRK
jgi:hypothetical protein